MVFPTTYFTAFVYVTRMFLKTSEAASFWGVDFDVCDVSAVHHAKIIIQILLQDSACAIELLRDRRLPICEFNIAREKKCDNKNHTIKTPNALLQASTKNCYDFVRERITLTHSTCKWS